MWASSRSGERELQELIRGREWWPVNFTAYEAQPTLVCYLVEGVSPLMLHSATKMKKREDKLGKKVVPAPEEEAEQGVLRDEEGNIIIPQEAFLLAMQAAAQPLRIGKERAVQRLRAAVFVPVGLRYVPVRRYGEPLKKYDWIDCRRVVVQRQGVLRARAVIGVPWEVMGLLEVDTALIDLAVVAELLALSGFKAGIGDYRPEKGGAFGRYRLR